MRTFLLSVLVTLFSLSINAQVASLKTNKNLVPTKKYPSETFVAKKQSNKMHTLKRTVKLIREEKNVPTKS